MTLTVAYSACPNDTFMFHDFAAGSARPAGRDVDVHLHDVETLNRLALLGRYDVTKVSFHAWLLIRAEYRLLGAGAALGFGCGPVVVSKREIPAADLPACRIAVPGELTTAHLLLRLWQPEATDKVFTTYDRIVPMIASGEVDAGVVIHEGRFTYGQAGLRLIADLGEWWRERTDLPIPLGGIVAHKRLGESTIREVEGTLTRAIANSLADPGRTVDYVRQHAHEMDEAVLRKHIETFVNDFSLALGPQGRAAVAKLEELAAEAGVIA